MNNQKQDKNGGIILHLSVPVFGLGRDRAEDLHVPLPAAPRLDHFGGDDVHKDFTNISARFNYRNSDVFKTFAAVEYRRDAGNTYWGTPLVPASFAGSNAVSGVVSGSTTTEAFDTHDLKQVTIDSRTLKTNYNVLDNFTGARELWLRTGFEWAVTDDVTLKSQVYSYQTKRTWLDSETYAFNPGKGLGTDLLSDALRRIAAASQTIGIAAVLVHAKDDAAARSRFLEIMAGQAERMRRLIEDLLSLSRIELNEHVMPQGQVALDSLLRHLADTLELRAKTGTAPATGTEGTLLSSIAIGAGVSFDHQAGSSDVATAWDHIWIYTTGGVTFDDIELTRYTGGGGVPLLRRYNGNVYVAVSGSNVGDVPPTP